MTNSYDDANLLEELRWIEAHGDLAMQDLARKAANRIDELKRELEDERYRHDRYADYCVAADKARDALEARMKWISTMEQLPEDGVRVLTFDKRGHMRDRALYAFAGGVLLFRPDGFNPMLDVLYWMPLPDLPKMKE